MAVEYRPAAAVYATDGANDRSDQATNRVTDRGTDAEQSVERSDAPRRLTDRIDDARDQLERHYWVHPRDIDSDIRTDRARTAITNRQTPPRISPRPSPNRHATVAIGVIGATDSPALLQMVLIAVANIAGGGRAVCETTMPPGAYPRRHRVCLGDVGVYAATSSPCTVNAQITSIDIARTAIPHTV